MQKKRRKKKKKFVLRSVESRFDGQVEESLKTRRKNGCIGYLGTVKKTVKKAKFLELCVTLPKVNGKCDKI